MTDSSEIAPGYGRLLRSQRAFFDAGRTASVGDRLAPLRRLRAAIESRRDEVLGALAEDLAKPPLEAFLAEYHFLVSELRLVEKSLQKWAKPRRAGNPVFFLPAKSWVERQPFGAALVLSTWNYPIQLGLGPLVAAVAAGNSVVLKPSEFASASAALVGELVRDCFDPGHATVVQGDAGTARALTSEPFDFFFFTGSTRAGRDVAAKAAGHLAPSVLELGGKCPCVINRDADLATAARRLLTGKLLNAGQTCFAPDFAAVHDSVKDDFVEELERLLRSVPWAAEMARIVNRRHYDRLRELVSGEAAVICGGDDDAGALRLAPRVLPEASWASPAMREEVFGPVLPVLAFGEKDELATRLRALPSPLALYCFSRDQGFARWLAAAVPSGSVCINDTMKQATNLELPFGGVGPSGHGRYRGRSGFEAFTYERPFTRRYFVAPDPFEVLPPYERQFRRLLSWLK